MKPETKNKLMWVLCAPVLVLLFGSAAMTLATTWNDRFATKEYVSSHYVSKEFAQNFFYSKAEGASQKATIAAMEKQISYMRQDVKTMVSVILRMDQKLDKHLVLNERIVRELTKEPPPDPPKPPVKIANGN
jgi:TolA-binding protein